VEAALARQAQAVMEALVEAAAVRLLVKLRAMEQQIQEAVVVDQTLHLNQEEQAALVL
jgi:hypothetical protein